MDLRMFCPVCGQSAKRATFSQQEMERDFVCDKCSTLYIVTLLDSDSKNKEKINDGLLMRLKVSPDKTYAMQFIDSAFPIIHCILHPGKKSIGEPDEEMVSSTCVECGAQYEVSFESA